VKTAHAVALARQVTAAGRPCRAIHWVASEDHDTGEANHADLVGRDGRLRRISADLGPGRAALRHRPALAGWSDLLQALEQHCGPGPGRSFLEGLTPRAGESWGTWQSRFLQACFPDLLVVEPHHLRQAGAAALQRVVERWNDVGTDLRNQGWESFFGALAAPPLFEDLPTGRLALDGATALARLRSAPDQISTGAGLRPVLQQATLPVLASVVGPGEAAYHGALAPIFAAAGIHAPHLIPRCQATLAPSWYLRACSAWAADPATGQAPEPTPAERPRSMALLDELLAELAPHPHLAGHHRRLATLGQRLERRLQVRPHPVPRGALRHWAKPRDLPQDRVMSCAQALWEWGPGLTELLVSQIRQAEAGVSVLIRP